MSQKFFLLKVEMVNKIMFFIHVPCVDWCLFFQHQNKSKWLEKFMILGFKKWMGGSNFGIFEPPPPKCPPPPKMVPSPDGGVGQHRKITLQNVGPHIRENPT